jgi:Trk K+ transport system NAD-binding subunit
MSTDGPVLLIGPGDLADEVRRALDALGADLVRLVEPTRREVEEVFQRGPVRRAVVVAGKDAFALRMALMVRHVSEDVELLVTLFNPTIGEQLAQRIEPVTITSLADIVAPVLAAGCLRDDLGAIELRDGRSVGVRVQDDHVHEEQLDIPAPNKPRMQLESILRPYDKSAALMFYGIIGLLAVLVAETVGAMIVLDQGLVDAFYGSARTLVTVGPNDEVSKGPSGFKVFIGFTILCALVFEAFFTAGIVNRLIDRRLTGLMGRRAMPRRDHVIVVGLGQVGLRLAQLLQRAGVGVVAVDEREDGENVGLARELGLPVVVGRGADPSLLRELSLRSACALAAATDDDLENVSIAMAALSHHPQLRIVLRVGDGRLANETRSLEGFAVVRDVHRIAAAVIAARAMGAETTRAVCSGEEIALVHADGSVEPQALEHTSV